MNVSSEYLNAICEGCLSPDRQTAEITEFAIKKVFYEILNDADGVDNLTPRLCFECKASIQRFLSFKRQVIEAHDTLTKHLLKPPKETFSKLSLNTQAESETICNKAKTSIKTEDGGSDVGYYVDDGCHDDKDVTQRPSQETISKLSLSTQAKLHKTEPGLQSVHPSKNTDGGSDDGYYVDDGCQGDDEDDKDFTQRPSQETISKLSLSTQAKLHKTEPGLQSVHPSKNTDGGSDDGYYVDDGCQGDDEDDKDFTAELHSSTDYVEPIKIKLRKNKNKIEYDFNDSDEEPLNNKKRKTEKLGVKREKKRRKNNELSPKIDKRKHPAPKREKPAGVVSNPRVSKKLQQLNVGEGQLEMVVLSWEEVEAERQKALLSVVFTRHEYRCYDCVLGFNHKFKLENHMKKHEPSAGEMVCSVCKVRCRDAHALCAHRRRHRVRWRCCVCGALCSRAAVAADHVARQHGATPATHTCRVCGHCEPTLGKLRNHIKNHGERQKCELCGKTFRDRTSLRTHLFIHKGEKEYSCPRCEKRFLFKKAMEVHLVTHEAPAHLYCYECDMNFKNRMSFTQHMKYSLKHIDPAKLKYACQFCDKKFMKATRLEEHNLAVHLKATPIRCTTAGCDFSCSSRPVLRTHLRMIHRNARALRNHVCHTCGKTYTTKKTLEGHLRSHTGERPFKCSQCPSTFGYEAALYNHNKLVHLKAKAKQYYVP